MLPWIHLDDVVSLIVQGLDRRDMRGRYNAVAPGIVTHQEFMQEFARRLRRPILWNAPEALVRRIVGDERASILLRGQLVRPKRTLESGFRFSYPDVSSALDHLVQITI